MSLYAHDRQFQVMLHLKAVVINGSHSNGMNVFISFSDNDDECMALSVQLRDTIRKGGNVYGLTHSFD